MAGTPAHDTATQSAAGRLKQFILQLLLESPDSHVFWVPIAFLRGCRVLLTTKVDVVYSSSPPHSSHVAAFLLSKLFRKPHVVDFRDPWIVPDEGIAVLRRLERLVKRTIVQHAAKVVVVSPGEPEELRRELSDLDLRDIEVLTNGFDPDDFELPERKAPEPERFTITHAGTIYPETGSDFFRALEYLQAEEPALARALQVNLVGDVDPQHDGTVRRLEEAGIVRRHGLQPHRTALALANDSDALLILQRGRTSGAHLPAKVFEYLFIARPILAITDGGCLHDLLTQSRLGITARPGDIRGIAATIRAMYDDRRAGGPRMSPDGAFISRFDRRQLAARFATVLQEAAHAGEQ
jgi:glycosyltransferase involved in cell wall biosynthesis